MRRLYHIIKQGRFHPDKTPGEFDGSLPFLPPAIELGPPNPQHGSLFQLPTEIYTLILASAFSGHYVHINLLPLPLSHLGEPNFVRYDRRSDAVKKRHKTWSRSLFAEAKMMVWRGYFDLVHMLYTTNTFTLNTHRLAEAILTQVVPGMPQIISPMIHQVTFLELFVGFRLFQSRRITQDGPTPDELSERQHFRTFVDLLPKALPNLQSLHIFFDHGIFYNEYMISSHIEELETEFFEPLRFLAGELPRLRHFSIAAEYWVHIKALVLDGMNSPKYCAAHKTEGLHGIKAWYPSGGSKEDRGRPGTGFWVKKGTTARRILSEKNKMLYGLVCCPGCFRGCTD